MGEHNELGIRGEARAVSYLQRTGHRIITRNWRGAAGEIDIVATRGRDLIVVEVKTRRTTAFGDPLAAVDASKLARVWRAACEWRQQHPGTSRGLALRVDVIGITGDGSDDGSEITHLRDVR